MGHASDDELGDGLELLGGGVASARDGRGGIDVSSHPRCYDSNLVEKARRDSLEDSQPPPGDELPRSDGEGSHTQSTKVAVPAGSSVPGRGDEVENGAEDGLSVRDGGGGVELEGLEEGLGLGSRRRGQRASKHE